MTIAVRVMAKTDAARWRVITVDPDGAVQCDCAGWDGTMCSHVDAVLVHNERGMVHPDDLASADQAAQLARGKITVPEGWQGSWRRERAWRGLAPRQRAGVNPRRSGKPLVCFTGAGAGKTRAAWQAEAAAHGWDVAGSASPFTAVLVAADPTGRTEKLETARQHHTPIVSYDEWPDVMRDGVLPD